VQGPAQTDSKLTQYEEWKMENVTEALNEMMKLDGAMCAALVDSESGMILGEVGSGIDIELAAAGNTEVVRAKLKTMHSLNLDDRIEDMLITLGKQYHIIRPLTNCETVFMYIVLDKTRSNLALARRKAKDVEGKLSL